jgi:hypothetical protein
MVTILLKVQALAMAVRYLSESATIKAAESPLRETGQGVMVFQLELNLDEQRRESMFPHWKFVRCCKMIDLILMLSLKCLGVNARISMSKWKRSHQKALELCVVCDARIAVINRSRMDSRKCCYVDWKWGGLLL